jgi:hypothetical protein
MARLDSDKVMRLMDAADQLSARFDKMCARGDGNASPEAKGKAMMAQRGDFSAFSTAEIKTLMASNTFNAATKARMKQELDKR